MATVEVWLLPPMSLLNNLGNNWNKIPNSLIENNAQWESVPGVGGQSQTRDQTFKLKKLILK